MPVDISNIIKSMAQLSERTAILSLEIIPEESDSHKTSASINYIQSLIHAKCGGWWPII